MNITDLLAELDEVPEGLYDEAIWDSFCSWARQRGITLYPHQEDASLAAMTGDHVIVATPTGSGKSLIAVAAHFAAMAKKKRSFYTAPIKALVSEKFFSLCDIFGADNVGMMTGDATVNSRAPIICATAEIVANMALRRGDDAGCDQVIMDEFHYYSDPGRGWAWQVPLIELSNTQFILMSATLGDVDWLTRDLKEKTGRDTVVVADAKRPVPLDFDYVYTPVQETIENLLAENMAPLYVVHFTQREATERAQALSGLKVLTPEEKEAIAEQIGSFRFTTSFGKTLSSLVRRGIGIHHAGMLPKYRRLVERLSQTGLLKVICGTDTLGVGINVPIRTVVMTGLAKFDGTKTRILKSREFHQIAGRAGRAGFDTEGHVVIEAPEHEIENYRARQRAGADPKKLKKLRKKAAKSGEVTWAKSTYERLTTAEPEQLTSQFRMSTSMLLNVLARKKDGYESLKHLLTQNHNTKAKQNKDILTTIELFRGLEAAGIVVRRPSGTPDEYGRIWTLTEELSEDFALNQPLAPFALAALEILDKDSDTYTLDVISVIEAILDDPRQLLVAQQRARRDEELAALTAEGVDYTQRMAIIQDITWPKPLADELDEAMDIYARAHPWVKEFDISPKSVVRHMIENGMNFSDLISTYQLSRSEGVVLRYLTDAWRTLRQSIPETASTPQLDDIVCWLGELIRQVDSSLVDEWAHMQDPDKPISGDALEAQKAFGVTDPTQLTANKRAFTIMVRNAMFGIVQLFAWEKEKRLAAMFDYLADPPDFGAGMDAYFDEYADIDTGSKGRGKGYFVLSDTDTRKWHVRQILADPEGDNSFAIVATVDLDESDAAGEVRFSDMSLEYH